MNRFFKKKEINAAENDRYDKKNSNNSSPIFWRFWFFNYYCHIF